MNVYLFSLCTFGMYQESDWDTEYKIIYKQLLGNGARLLESDDNYDSDMIECSQENNKKARRNLGGRWGRIGGRGLFGRGICLGDIE